MRRLALPLVALVLLAAGCGGGSNESSATTETTTTETTTSDTGTTETTTTEASTGGETTTDLSSVLGDEDCLALASVGASMAQAFSGTSGDLSDDDTAKLDELASKVPDDIKSDVQVLAKAFSTYAAKLKAIGIKTGATPTADQLQQLQTALASLDQQEITDASNHIEAWAKQNCTG